MGVSSASNRRTPSAGKSLHAPGDPGSGMAISIRDAAGNAEQARDQYRPCQEELDAAERRRGGPPRTARHKEAHPPRGQVGSWPAAPRVSGAGATYFLPFLLNVSLRALAGVILMAVRAGILICSPVA